MNRLEAQKSAESINLYWRNYGMEANAIAIEDAYGSWYVQSNLINGYPNGEQPTGAMFNKFMDDYYKFRGMSNIRKVG